MESKRRDPIEAATPGGTHAVAIAKAPLILKRLRFFLDTAKSGRTLAARESPRDRRGVERLSLRYAPSTHVHTSPTRVQQVRYTFYP